jgi:hypothetical protein
MHHGTLNAAVNEVFAVELPGSSGQCCASLIITSASWKLALA